MGTARVTITFQGIDEVVANLSDIEMKAGANLQKLTGELAKATESAWRQSTPIRTGKLQAADVAQVSDLSFTLVNPVYYYKFVDEGHNTPAGWRTRHGYRPAKRRSHVAARNITKAALQFVEQNITNYLSKFLDGV